MTSSSFLDRSLADGPRADSVLALRALSSAPMNAEGGKSVRDGMSAVTDTIGPTHTVGEAARRMVDSRVGAAIVVDPEEPAPGVLTERDVLRIVARDGDPKVDRVADHLTANATSADSEWPLERAAEAMISGGFRHLVVVDGGQLVGVLSMRGLVRTWSEAGELPSGGRVGDEMSTGPLTVEPEDTVRDASQRMAERKVGAAIVRASGDDAPGILTERDVLRLVGRGSRPASERVADHYTPSASCAGPDWPLERAAAAMVDGNFRHLVVLDGGEVAGMISMRDLVRAWTSSEHR